MLKRKKPLAKNKKPIARKTPLKSSRHPLVRTALRQNRGKPKRFAKRRNPEYVAFIRGLPCALKGKGLGKFCEGPVEATHVKSRGAGGDDYGNLIPLCRAAHQEQHAKGIQWFADEYFYHPDGSLAELRRIAAEVYPAQWLKQKALGWPEESRRTFLWDDP